MVTTCHKYTACWRRPVDSQICYAWKALIDKLIKLASLQTSFKTLDDALKVTNRRVNALKQCRAWITLLRH